MASIPLPALQIEPTPQTDFLGQMGKVAALKTILQNQQYQQQLQPLELQKTQQDLATSQLGYQQKQLEMASDQAWANAVSKRFGPKEAAQAQATSDMTQQAPPAVPPPSMAPPTAPLSTLAPPPDGSVPPAGPPPPPPGFIGPARPPSPDQTLQSAQTAPPPAVTQAASPAPAGNFLDGFQDVITDALQNGATMGSVLDKAGKVLTMQDTFAKMTETQQKTVLAQNKAGGELANAILVGDTPEKQAQAWGQAQQSMKLMGPQAAVSMYGQGLAGYIMQNPYPGQKAVTEHMGLIQAADAMLEDQKKRLENKDLAQKVEFPDDTRQQINAGLDGQFFAMTGQHLTPDQLLKPGDGQRALDNFNDMAKTIFGSPAVKARISSAEAWARVGPEVSAERQKIEMRQKMLPDPVAGVAPNLVPKAISEADKAGHEYVTAQAAAQEMQSMIDMMRSGNKVAYEYSPVTGVLAINLGNQTKRINMSEIKSYKGSGSSWDNLDGWFGKKLKGEGIPDNIVNDMEQLHQQLGNNAADTYRHNLEITNSGYGSKFQPVQLSPNTAPVAPNANTAPVAPNANKPAVSATPPVQPAPTGMVSVQIPGQKPGWVSRSQVEQFKRKYPNATVSQ